MDFTHLHNHSQYSIMDGLCSTEELLIAAKNLGHTALAVTDHGTLSAHRSMQRDAAAHGMKPILGLEAYISETDRFDRRSVKQRDDNTSVFNHIILLAEHQDGLKNLQKLSEIAWGEGFYRKPRIDLELLEEYREGLIVLSGCMNGLVSKAIERGNDDKARQISYWFKKILGNNFYMEIQPHNPVKLNLKLIEIADGLEIPLVATADSHFATEDQRALEEALLILSTKPKFNPEFSYAESVKMDIFERYNYVYPDRPISFEKIDVFIQSREQIEKAFEAQGIFRPDALDNTVKIANQVSDYEFYENMDLLPVPKRSADSQLREKCIEGLHSRGVFDDAHYQRMDEELEVIKKKKFSPYFLIVADMINYARSNGIMVGPGRGSAAGSLVVYLLGITEVDPLEYNLLFARFINEERNDWPDIDIDIMDSRRSEVKEYLVKKYKNACSIATYSFFKDKGVVRDAARVFMVPLSEVNSALKPVDTFEDFMSSPNTEEFRRKYPEVVDLAENLRGTIRGTGMHASGIIVSKEPISNYAPIETRKDPSSIDERVNVIAYDMDEAAQLGFIKIDVLGLKTLTVLSTAIDVIEERTGKRICLTDLPLDDAAVYRDLSEGNTKGVFQAEQVAYTNLLVKMGVRNFEELVASNALVRPGAMNTVGAKYIARKRGDEVTSYVHKIMQPFLENTYGVIIYQEQVMQACVNLAGMSWSDADKIRKIIGKKKDVHEFDQFKFKFIEGAGKHISVDDAEQLWHDFEAHAGYSFNRSHAVAYSMLSYWTAWMKHYYPLEFMYAILRMESDKDARTDYLLEAKRLGLRVLLPHVNESEVYFSIQGDALRFGFSDIKFLTEKTGEKIVKRRPYNSYEDLKNYSEEKNSGISSRVLGALNAVGAAAFEDNPRTGNESENYYEYLNIPKFDIKDVPRSIKNQLSTLSEFEQLGTYVFMAMVKSIKRGNGWSRVELVDETNSIGVFHGENTQIEPNNMYFFLVGDNRIHRYVSIDDVVDKKDDYFVKYLYAESIPAAPGKYAVIDFTPYKTKSGNMMGHLILADGEKNLSRVVVFPKNYKLAIAKMRPGMICQPVIDQTDDKTKFVKEIA